MCLPSRQTAPPPAPSSNAAAAPAPAAPTPDGMPASRCTNPLASAWTNRAEAAQVEFESKIRKQFRHISVSKA